MFASLTDAVVMVQHRGHAVEPEAIKAVLLHPPAQVRQQEPQHFPARKTHKRSKHTHTQPDNQEAVNYSPHWTLQAARDSFSHSRMDIRTNLSSISQEMQRQY